MVRIVHQEAQIVFFCVLLTCEGQSTTSCNATLCSSKSSPRCSMNIDCECFSLPSNPASGICAVADLSCSSVVRCNPDGITCSMPNTVCVNNTRCQQPVCYPSALANTQICPPVMPENGVSIATQSGSFLVPSTWSSLLSPGAGTTVVIPAGITVTLNSTNQLSLSGITILVFGQLRIGGGSPYTSYTFVYPVNIYVYNGGIVQDSTRNRSGIYFNVNSSVIIYNGGYWITQGPSYIYIYYLQTSAIRGILQLNNIVGPYSLTITYSGQIYNNG
ncbi:unnamed protein product [Didymodactylos carnosus]|uniref:Uncharacterized protein n=1 Tax=Didymodactylos carnosus TaxID=1234261 RepID=A0A814SBW8_9BILA|nr:unnamed protein product [Didymodactylos carnosus]CAF1145365.1 unnamed protein product [Didymodactylos carnosus]CAF3866110.1 unnamed protein product [Didymodactylos carnosus]CAF3909046.1 unnamed protein product [Didymodactylos carnosus]